MITVHAPVELKGKMTGNETLCKGEGTVTDKPVTELMITLKKSPGRKMVGAILDEE
jgi:hypothetical protein